MIHNLFLSITLHRTFSGTLRSTVIAEVMLGKPSFPFQRILDDIPNFIGK